jgi:MFS transporter, ACS family, hexuronate transporter
MIMEKPIGNYRWRILALLFFATTINYLDRSIINVLGPTLRNHIFYWTDQDYANITIAFKVAYSLGLLVMGGLIDKFGTRIGYTVSIAIWSIFGMLHACITKSMGWIGFALARFGLGFGESGNFPAAVKTVAEWFPKKERAFANGLFNAGSNVGAILAPLIVLSIVSNDGTHWQFAFLVTGFLSALWVFLWLKTYHKPEMHSKLSKDELTYINSDSEPESTEKLPWKKLFGVKETWAFAILKSTDAVWLFYIFWSGFFLNRNFGLELSGLALPLMIIYLAADFGSIFGGWISSHLIKIGWSVNRARKLTLLFCAIAILPVVFAPQTHNQWIAILLIALAAAGHQAWSANVMTIASDVFPKKATASVIGIGGMVGYALGVVTDLMLGNVLTNSGAIGYVYAFSFAGSFYLITLLVVHLMMPHLISLDENLAKGKG